MTDANFPDSYISEIEDFFEKRILNNVYLNRHYHGDFINMYLDFPSESEYLENYSRYLSIIHTEINRLLDFMIKKSKTNRHFNAQESVALIELIEEIKRIKIIIKYRFPQLLFKLEHSYESFIIECSKFLSLSGGSTIPENIEIPYIEHMPIFYLENTIEIENAKIHQTLSYRGEGSYAIVYKYKHPVLDIPIALKKAKKELKTDELERFKEEFLTLKKFNSPFIVTAYYYEEATHSYHMEFVDSTLKQFIDANNSMLPINLRKNIISQLILALKYVHEQNLLHRDLNPNNILMQNYNDLPMIKIADFGLVKNLEEARTNPHTEIKGSWNDFSDLDRVGFHNYSMVHEIYAVTKIIVYILTGKTNLSNLSPLKFPKILKFISIGTNPNPEVRFKNILEIRDFVFSNDLFSEVNL
ncbi:MULTISPECIES: protein kinase [unclassified Exiguobacterium]|uniref:protein kinase domain-containing protein n=1 Tax=unclassified Exiguobacterium TaxID=2644629 RepID=UPI001BEAF8DF|nr:MULTISPECIES: protein kinase [unclassified Exiguobacterium]